MKVWHIISNRWNSAISEYALSAAKASRLLEADVLVTPLSQSPIEKRFEAAGFLVSSAESVGPRQYSKFAGIAAKFAPDIIFTYGGPETTAALFFKGKSKLVRFHGYMSEPKSPLFSAARKLGHLHVDLVIAPSESARLGVADSSSCPVRVLTLGCDTQKFHVKNMTRGTRPELLIFGRLDPVKGHREFLLVFRKLLDLADERGLARPLLRIVGLPENLSPVHIQESALALGIASEDLRIQCERVANVAELMSGVSLGVVSSLGSEAICRVAEEFLLCGTPVVTTEVGSLKDVFMDSTFGACYQNNRALQAAPTIAEVLWPSHQETLLERRHRATEAEKYFSIRAMAESLSDILRQI